jgi:hypothetical protein
MDAAGGGNDDHLLAAARPSGPFGVAEGLAGHGDAVDPGLELARHAEVVHGRADDDGVRREFFDALSQGGFVFLRGVTQFGRGIGGDQAGRGQVADGIGGEVAIGDLTPGSAARQA